MSKRRAHQGRPLILVLWRRGVALPIEDRLLAAGQLARHETQLQEGLESRGQIVVHHPVKVGEIVADALTSLRISIGLVDRHIVAEQPVAADVPEPAQRLHGSQLILIFPLQRQAHAARAYAEGGIVVKLGPGIGVDHDFIFFHLIRPLSALSPSNTNTWPSGSSASRVRTPCFAPVSTGRAAAIASSVRPFTNASKVARG